MVLFMLTMLLLVLTLVYKYVCDSNVVAMLIVILMAVICTACETLIDL